MKHRHFTSFVCLILTLTIFLTTPLTIFAQSTEQSSEADTTTDTRGIDEAHPEQESGQKEEQQADLGSDQKEDQKEDHKEDQKEDHKEDTKSDAEAERQVQQTEAQTEQTTEGADDPAATELKVDEKADTETESTESDRTIFEAQYEGVTVTATLQDPSDLPADAQLFVSPAEVTDQMNEAVCESGPSDAPPAELTAYDISFRVNGTEVEPLHPVQVGMSVPQNEKMEEMSVFHVDDHAAVVQNMNAVTSADGELSFVADHFSVYIIATQKHAPVQVVFEHYYKTDQGESRKLYQDSIVEMLPGDQIDTASVLSVEDWQIQSIVKISADKKETEVQETDSIQGASTYRIYYTKTAGSTSVSATLYDYLVQPYNISRGYNAFPQGSINSNSNYRHTTGNNRFTIGTYSGNGAWGNNFPQNGYHGYVPGTTIDANVYHAGQRNGAVHGIVTGLSANYRDVLFSMDEPGVFSDQSRTGKKILDGYTLGFERSGDTFEFKTVSNSAGRVTAHSGSNFFPLDGESFPQMQDSGSDQRHNYFFGLRYDVDFKLGEYVGPLNYQFSGDDDLWVILDGNKVVVDLGGIHDALSATVNLWDALGMKEGIGALTEQDKQADHRLTILYLERGANLSNNTMRFTLPSTSGVIQPTHTDSHETEYISESGQITWDDTDNQDGKRPASLHMQLLADGIPVQGQEKEASETNGWKYEFTDLPKYENGASVTYTVQPEIAESYTSAVQGMNIRYSHKTEKTNMTVHKEWIDDQDRDGIRPAEVQVQLYADGAEYRTPAILNQANDWTSQWSELPAYQHGNKVAYSTKEVTVPEGYTATTERVSAVKNVIYNRHTAQEMTVKGTVTWVDEDNADRMRPSTVSVTLYADGTAIQNGTCHISETDSWSYSFDHLPKYKDGTEIQYTVTENEIPEYTSTIHGFHITNTYTPERTGLTVIKHWEDGNNQDGLRPDSVKVQLYANDQAKGDPVTLSEADHWSASWNGLKAERSGRKIIYTVREIENVKGYQSSTDNTDPENVIITNTHVPETCSLKGTIHWEDENDRDGKRPTAVHMHLLADGDPDAGATRLVTQADGWNYEFDHLPRFSRGVLIHYTVTEDSVTDYSTSIDGFHITNAYTPAKTSVTVTKHWEDENNQDGLRPDKIKVRLCANGKEIGKTMILNNRNNWTYTWDGLNEKEEQAPVQYTVIEVEPTEGYSSLKNDTDKGNIILTNAHIPTTISIDGRVRWRDTKDQDGLRPKSVEVMLLADGLPVPGEARKVSAESGWEYHFQNLPQFSNGSKIIYTVTENAIGDYGTGIRGYQITNTYTPAKTSLTVTKHWEDHEDQDRKRPQEISIHLYANGIPVGSKVLLNEKNNWTKTWKSLNENFFGMKIHYEVRELTQSEGYTCETMELGPGNLLIINTYTPQVETVSDSMTETDGRNYTQTDLPKIAPGSEPGESRTAESRTAESSAVENRTTESSATENSTTESSAAENSKSVSGDPEKIMSESESAESAGKPDDQSTRENSFTPGELTKRVVQFFAPETGDHAPVLVLVICLLISGAIIIIGIRWRRKKK